MGRRPAHTMRVARSNTIDYVYVLPVRSGERNLFMEDGGMTMRGMGHIDVQVGEVHPSGVAAVRG